ncbi:fungal specific transcription factor domain-containing protein [Colletotrichum truncatum]|uniref:Fungal specific transcription factor domain-containing protein n=1 Tax=Colletotrichum truncatum TaxID=5467 RepID=A0ACC3YVZ9_COLTU|nr:fungal specific transcription factor domain-containing protein [Colletotrichum truncatum]KAF6791209.1 fungal specific transcription factor domain-containing protein [Colletotrichum truncatum]
MDVDSEPTPRRGVRKSSGQPAGAPTPRRFRSASQAEAARTSNACQICRDKKVKCSGQQPCKYCAKRGLECVFAASEKRKLYSVSQIRELENKVAFYERQSREQSAPAATTSSGPTSPMWRMPSDEANGTSSAQQEPPQEDSCISVSVLSPTGFDQPETTVSQATLSPTFERIRAIEVLPATTSSPTRTNRAIAPESALSSSETFGSEIKTLLVSRSNPGSAASPATNTAVSPLPRIDRRGLLEAIGPWPTEEEAHAMLDIVVFNVGISQQLFDVRAFSDNLSILYQDSAAEVRLSEIWIVEALLVFSVGRLLQSRDDENGDLPGTSFFREAVKRTPLLSELRKHGIIGVEVMALTALYLQIVDRKDDAYIHSNTALRLAISHGMHRGKSSLNIRRSENVHRNRLWWSIYMQERRLCAAGGYPMSIEDYAITVVPPYEVLGFPSATALDVNVKAARITGKITSTIYSQKGDPENTFINNVQDILHSLYEVEKTMPSEYSMEIKPSGLLVAGRPFVDAPTSTSRTSSSLYISVYSAVIHTVRPILLYMARNSRDPERGGSRNEVSPALVRLAEICVETASKSLVILQELRKKEILAKNAFLDLDATFSVGYIFVLVEAINPGKSLGFKGIEGSRAILRYLVSLGNRAAANRLAELDQMCMHLALPVQQATGQTPQQPLTDLLTQTFSFSNGYGNVDHVTPGAVDGGLSVEGPSTRSAEDDGGTMGCGNDDQTFGLSGADLASIPLEGENGLYWVYHTPGFSFTGVEQTDWEALENQIPWGNQP